MQRCSDQHIFIRIHPNVTVPMDVDERQARVFPRLFLFQPQDHAVQSNTVMLIHD
jgi:hypothetical protein